MTDAYERLKSLFSDMGLDVSVGSYAEAEIYALSSGIECVKELFGNTFGSIFYTFTDSPCSAEAYAFMLGIDSSATDEETFERVFRSRLSQNYGYGALKDAYIPELLLLDGYRWQRDGERITVDSLPPEKLIFFGKYIAGGVPFCNSVYINGSGLTFSQWDSLGKTFAFYGRLCLPFSCLDTMNAQIMQV